MQQNNFTKTISIEKLIEMLDKLYKKSEQKSKFNSIHKSEFSQGYRNAITDVKRIVENV